MRLSDFDYNLPKELIAQKPKWPRDWSKLFVYNKADDQVEHKRFYDLLKYLEKGDVLVFNDSKVMPARLIGKKESGGKIEILLLKNIDQSTWEVIIGGKGKKEGLFVSFAPDFSAILEKRLSDKTWLVKFNKSDIVLDKYFEKYGVMPLPPYIDSKLKESKLRKKYQTIYAQKTGSAAAPTAGLHFTKALKNRLNKIGVQLEYITLHVGLGTFEPVSEENITDHKIHKEWVSVDKNTLLRLREAKINKRRIIAVGTTSARTLEALADKIKKPENKDINQEVDIYIYPSYEFKIIDGLITNFHLPKSTLIMLVSAFIGHKKTMELYKIAIEMKYRFYSFGDAMLLLKIQNPNIQIQNK